MYRQNQNSYRQSRGPDRNDDGGWDANKGPGAKGSQFESRGGWGDSEKDSQNQAHEPPFKGGQQRMDSHGQRGRNRSRSPRNQWADNGQGQDQMFGSRNSHSEFQRGGNRGGFGRNHQGGNPRIQSHQDRGANIDEQNNFGAQGNDHGQGRENNRFNSFDQNQRQRSGAMNQDQRGQSKFEDQGKPIPPYQGGSNGIHPDRQLNFGNQENQSGPRSHQKFDPRQMGGRQNDRGGHFQQDRSQGHGGRRPQNAFGGGQQNLELNTSKNGYYTDKMRNQLPPYFANIFRARPPVEYIPPDSLKNYKSKGYVCMNDPISKVFDRFEDEDQLPKIVETREQIKQRVKKEKLIQHLIDQKSEIKSKYNPDNDSKIKGDPDKTIFVGRLSFKTEDSELQRVFGSYGDIKRLRIVRHSETNKSLGYAFIEFYEKRAAEIAYNRGDRRKIDGFTVLVDREQSRKDKYWVPRRLGGGKGGDSRRNRDEEQYIKEIKKELRESQKKEKEEKDLKEAEQRQGKSGEKDKAKNGKDDEDRGKMKKNQQPASINLEETQPNQSKRQRKDSHQNSGDKNDHGKSDRHRDDHKMAEDTSKQVLEKQHSKSSTGLQNKGYLTKALGGHLKASGSTKLDKKQESKDDVVTDLKGKVSSILTKNEPAEKEGQVTDKKMKEQDNQDEREEGEL